MPNNHENFNEQPEEGASDWDGLAKMPSFEGYTERISDGAGGASAGNLSSDSDFSEGEKKAKAEAEEQKKAEERFRKEFYQTKENLKEARFSLSDNTRKSNIIMDRIEESLNRGVKSVDELVELEKQLILANQDLENSAKKLKKASDEHSSSMDQGRGKTFLSDFEYATELNFVDENDKLARQTLMTIRNPEERFETNWRRIKEEMAKLQGF